MENCAEVWTGVSQKVEDKEKEKQTEEVQKY